MRILTQERKNLLEEIEQKTAEYEKILRNYNIRELMFRYQFINQYKDEIQKLEIKQKNNQIQLKDLEEKKKESEAKLSEMRKRLSEVENKNHSITESLNRWRMIRKLSRRKSLN
jgi:chromosome segregation ATPase